MIKSPDDVDRPPKGRASLTVIEGGKDAAKSKIITRKRRKKALARAKSGVVDKGGRPPHEPTEALRNAVCVYVAHGFTHAKIAELMCIALPTLYRYYRFELAHGMDKINARIAMTMAAIATNPNHKQVVQAGKYWLSRRGGPAWKEDRPDDDGNTDGTIHVSINIGSAGPGEGARVIDADAN